MPLQRCGDNGWRWGEQGKCYTGPGAKKKAIKQGLAIEGPDKFAQKATQEEFDIAISELNIDIWDKAYLRAARAWYEEQNKSTGTGE